jgi:uncharacterized OsmC-like protein
MPDLFLVPLPAAPAQGLHAEARLYLPAGPLPTRWVLWGISGEALPSEGLPEATAQAFLPFAREGWGGLFLPPSADRSSAGEDLLAAGRLMAERWGAPLLLVVEGESGAQIEAMIQGACALPLLRGAVLFGSWLESYVPPRLPLLVLGSGSRGATQTGVSLLEADALPPEAQGEVILSWIRGHLPTPAPDGATEPAKGHGTVVHVRTGKDRYRTEVRTRDHGWLLDEPRSLGGSDRGPTPNEALWAALGGCTAITLRMYADRKGWPLEAVEVRVHHRREGNEDQVDRELILFGPLDEEQRARLAEIADRCPVHRTLERGVHPTLRVRVEAGTRESGFRSQP